MVIRLILVICLSSVLVSFARADVDKVYHPYVEQDTYEFETRVISLLDSELAASFSIYRFGFGKDISESLFVEFYLIGARENSHNVEVEAYEIEALYQFTEQGEYWVDVGFLFEIERERNSKEWEGNFALLLEKEFGKWSAALNIHNQYLFEDDERHEWEFNQAFQLRYRYQSSFEPGFEIYSDKDNLYVGPVILGQIKLANSKLNWEVGVDMELNHSKSESVLRALFEWEF